MRSDSGADGQTARAVGSADGVAEREDALEALKESEALYRALFEQSPHGVAIVDPETQSIVRFNDTACRQLGYTREEFARLRIADIEAVETQSDIAAHTERMLERGADSFNTKHRTKSGEVREVAVTIRVLRLGGRPFIHCVFEDVTEARRVEDALRAGDTLFRQFVREVPAAVAMLDREMRYLFASKRWLADYNLGERDIIGLSHYEVFPEITDRWRAIHRRCLAGAVDRCEDDRFVRADGEVTWLRWQIQPWRDGRGEVGGIIIFSEDITERKRAEEALRASEARLEETIEMATAAYVRYDRDRRIVHVNRAWLDLYGYDSAEEVLGRHRKEFAVPANLPADESLFRRLQAGEEIASEENSRRRKDGSIGYHRISARAIVRDGAVVGFEGFLIDTTEQRRAALAAQADRVRLAMLATLGQLGATSLTVPRICDAVLECSLELSHSKIGYVFLYDEETQTLTKHAWSKDVLPECAISDRQTVYELAKTGLWGDPIRQRRPIVTNDYAAPNPGKRGRPEGHVALSRHLGLPVFDGERIVALVGVANKEEPYDDGDVLLLQQLMDGVWHLVERTRAAEESAAYTRRLEVLQEIDRQILAARSVEEIAELAADSLLRLLPCDGVVATRLDAQRGEAEIIAFSGRKVDLLTVGFRHPILHTVVPNPLTTAEIAYRPDLAALDERPPLVEHIFAYGIRSLASVPLHVDGKTIGFIHISSSSPNAFIPEHLEIARDVANQVAIGMRQAQLRAELEGERDLLRVLMDGVDDAIYFKDAESRFIRSNRVHTESVTAGTESSVIGKTDADLHDSAFARETLADEREIIRTGKPVINKIERVVSRAGDVKWVSTSKVPRRDESGRIVGTIGIGRDITEQRRIEEALRASEEKHRILLDESSDPIFSFSPDGRYAYANRAFANGVGKSVAEIVGKTIWDVFPKEEADKRFAPLSQVFRTGEEKVIEVRVPRADGDRYFVTTISAIKDKAGTVVSAICSSKDITERNRAEEALTRETALLARAQAISHMGSWRMFLETGRVDWSDEMYNIFGLDRATFSGDVNEAIARAVHPGDRAMMAELNSAVLRDGIPRPMDYRIVRPDGTVRWVHGQGEQERDATGRVVALAGFVQDITDRRAAEEALRASESKFHGVFDQSPIGIALFDRQGAIVDVNEACLKIFGITDLPSTRGLRLFDNLNLLADARDRLLRGETDRYESPFDFDLMRRLLSLDMDRAGKVVLDVLLSPLRDSADECVGYLAQIQDVTARRRAESVVRANQTRLAALAELGQRSDLSLAGLSDAALQKGIELTDSRIGYLYSYDEATQLFTLHAWSNDVMASCLVREAQTVYSLEKTGIWGEVVRQRRPIVANEFAAPHPQESGLPEGHVALDRFASVPVFSGDAIVAVLSVANKVDPYDDADLQQMALLMEGVVRLIERRRAEDEVRRYNERLQFLQELDRRILAAQSADEIAAYAVQQIRALVPCERASVGLFDLVANTARVAAVDEDEPLGEPAGTVDPLSLNRELEYERSGPTRYTPNLLQVEHPWPSLAKLIARGVRSLLSAPLVAGDELFGSINLMSAEPDGFDVESRLILREIADHAAVGFRQVALREELLRQNAVLEGRVAERTQALREVNAELNTFAYSVSHDLRAPLRALQGYSQILLDDYAEELSPESRVFAQRILGAARRMDRLVKDVLAFSRVTRAEIDALPLDLGWVVDEALGQIEGELADCGARVEVVRPLPTVFGHQATLVQVATNLIGNAAKYVAAGVRPEIAISAESSPNASGFVRLSVRDNGIGIAAENQERVFAAFERLHGVDEYPGSGLGLAIVKKGIERLGGRVGVESALGVGSRFWFELPTNLPNDLPKE